MDQSQSLTARSGGVGRIRSSAIRELLALVDRPGMISLAGGLPSAEHFPVEETREVIDELIGNDRGAFQYSATEGDRGLREWVAESRGVETDRVLITHGSQQALDLIGRATLGGDDPVALADPGYVGAIQVFRLNGGCLVGLPTDGEGLCVGALEEKLSEGLRPTLVYVVPNFHNPTGASLSEARARHLAQLAEDYGFLIVEDDPYGEIRFSGPAPPPLAALTERVVTVGTISKILFPGLRVGWVVAPAWLAPSLVLLKQAVDLHTSTFSQRIALGLVRRQGFLAGHLGVLRAHYASQARVLSKALAANFGDDLTVSEAEGGLFLWARIGLPGADTEALLPEAIEGGVGYVPGSAFSVGTPHREWLRLSFGTVGPEELVEGSRRLARVVLDRPGGSCRGGAGVTGCGPT
jgi:2-aminoadipate transaminase